MKGFDAVSYLANWGARNPALVTPITFHDPATNEAFWVRLRLVRGQIRTGFVGVDIGLEKAGHRPVKKFNYG